MERHMVAASAERKRFSSWVVLVYNRQISIQVGDGVDSPWRSFFHILSHHTCMSLRWGTAGRGSSQHCGQHTAVVFSVGGGTAEPDCDGGSEVMAV